MSRPYKYLSIERVNDIFIVRMQRSHGEDQDMEGLGAEFGRLIDEDNCRKLVLNLGPEDPECLISIFLAKLVNLQRRLEKYGGRLALAHLSENTQTVFHAAGIERFFHFYPDQDTAVNSLRLPA